MTIHIPRLRDEYMGYNCHIHALVADGLFTDKRETEPGTPEPAAVDVIDVSEYHPPRILSLAKTSSLFPGRGLGQLRRGPLSG